MKDFLINVSRYPRFLVTITLGIFLFAFEQVKPLAKNPVSAIALLGLAVSGFVFITLTLRAMLGFSIG